MFALEMLGWGFFIALAALSVAPLFAGGRLQRAVRWSMMAFGALSLLSVVGFVACGPLLLAVTIMLTVYFRRATRDEGVEGA